MYNHQNNNSQWTNNTILSISAFTTQIRFKLIIPNSAKSKYTQRISKRKHSSLAAHSDRSSLRIRVRRSTVPRVVKLLKGQHFSNTFSMLRFQHLAISEGKKEREATLVRSVCICYGKAESAHKKNSRV